MKTNSPTTTTKLTTTKPERLITEAHTETELDVNIEKWARRGYRLVLRFPKTALRIRVGQGLELEAGLCGALMEVYYSEAEQQLPTMGAGLRYMESRK